MNLLLNFLLWITLFQVANGEILVTLVNENGSPVAQESISFLTEEQQSLANCVTNSQGRCTITIENAPTDASGFIRGSLSISDRGQRPVLWPGGQIEIQLVQDSGKLSVPSDAYVTRTPKVDATPTVQEQATSLASEEQAQPTETAEAEPAETAEAEPAETAEIEPTETAEIEPTETVEEEPTTEAAEVEPAETAEAQAEQPTVSSSFLFQAFLFFIMAMALAFYIWPGNQKT